MTLEKAKKMLQEFRKNGYVGLYINYDYIIIRIFSPKKLDFIFNIIIAMFIII